MASGRHRPWRHFEVGVARPLPAMLEPLDPTDIVLGASSPDEARRLLVLRLQLLMARQASARLERAFDLALEILDVRLALEMLDSSNRWAEARAREMTPEL